MTSLTPHEVAVLFLSLGALLACARVLGELVNRWNQPSVLGELLAGILLGPTILGSLSPEFHDFLFPQEGRLAFLLDGLTTLAIVLFLLVAGIEVDLSTIWKQGRTAMSVGLAGIVIPFSLGMAAAFLVPQAMGRETDAHPFHYALFFATALSISALPVIAKTMMDLNLYRSDMGMVVIASAVFNDLIGWVIFAVILGLVGSPSGHTLGVGTTIWLTLLFAALMLTVGRWLVHRALPWVQAHTSWPGGVLGLALSLALFGAAATEWIGVHAIFGSFLVGVAIGDSSHLREHTRTVINQFVSFIFAPLFFASIGLRVNFALHFDWFLTLVVLMIACLGKVLGCTLGARVGGMAARESWALGFAMNARGAMEIILGLLALQSGLIRERMFVALVIMALATSLMSGPAMRRILRLKKPRRLTDYSGNRQFINPLTATDRPAAIRELCRVVANASPLSFESVEQAVLDRERIMSTGLGNGIAIPHARIENLTAPVVGVGLSRIGVDFDSPDGEPAHIIFLILTPTDDDGAQLEILADIARTFGSEETRTRALQVNSYTEFLAFMRTTANSG